MQTTFSCDVGSTSGESAKIMRFCFIGFYSCICSSDSNSETAGNDRLICRVGFILVYTVQPVCEKMMIAPDVARIEWCLCFTLI
jgi:hypothetical protein